MLDNSNKIKKLVTKTSLVKSLESLLKKYFGYDSFRPGQLDVILSVLDGNDTLNVMPTGGGKSLCYQIPSLVFKGLTVVVSPLIALMQDQVSQLESAGIPSLLLNSTLDWEVYCDNMSLIRSGKIKLLYCAPETLVTERIQKLLSEIQVDCLTIDEAHCISEWGHDFRPEYCRLSEIRKLFPKAVCLALTATATKNVRNDIKRTLGKTSKDKDWKEYISSFNRPNIYLEVQSKAGSAHIVTSELLRSIGYNVSNDFKLSRAEELVLRFIANHKEESGIIYCFSRRQVDELNTLLNYMGVNSLPYHAGLSDEERTENQIRFVRDEIPIIIATVAFGMGINKPNVRYVIHYDLPKSLEQYYQEIGRAGRDGEPAHALLLYSYGDTRKIQFFMKEKSGRELKIAQDQLQKMVDFAESRTCRRSVLLSHFGEKYQTVDKASKVDNVGNMCCDICSAGKGIDVDVTVPVQKLLSCVLRTGERFGASYVIDVLLGSRQKRILDNRHEKLSTWGIGTEYTKDDWFELVRLLLDEGFLRKSEEYSVLSLTQDARDTLSERGLVFLPFIPCGCNSTETMTLPKKIKITKKSNKLEAKDYLGQGIFVELKRMRKKLADELSVPPYVIFGDKTLEDIACKKPKSESELLNIYGIGEVKATRYGEFILRAVKDLQE